MNLYPFPPPPAIPLAPWAMIAFAAIGLIGNMVWQVRKGTSSTAVWLVGPVVGALGMLVLEGRSLPISVFGVPLLTLGAAVAALAQATKVQRPRWCLAIAGWNVLLALFLVLSTADANVYLPSRRVECHNNVKGIASSLLAAFDGEERLLQTTGWRAAYLESTSRPASALTCLLAMERRPELSENISAYGLPVGEATAFPAGVGVEFDAITDGTSNTVLLLECVGRQLPLFGDGDVMVDELPAGVNLPGSRPGMSDGWLSSYHPRGAAVGMADGHVRFVDEAIDPAVLKAFATIAGGEDFDDW